MTAEFHDDKMMFPQVRAWAWRDEPSGREVYSGWNDPRPANASEPLYDQAALYAAVKQANARQTAAWRLMTEKLVAAERERCAKLCDDLAVLESGDHFDGITADELARRIRGPNAQAQAPAVGGSPAAQC